MVVSRQRNKMLKAASAVDVKVTSLKYEHPYFAGMDGRGGGWVLEGVYKGKYLVVAIGYSTGEVIEDLKFGVGLWERKLNPKTEIDCQVEVKHDEKGN